MRYLKSENSTFYIKDHQNGYCVSIQNNPNKRQIEWIKFSAFDNTVLINSTRLEVEKQWSNAIIQLSAKMFECEVSLNDNLPTEVLEKL